jgi:hypothetical protein
MTTLQILKKARERIAKGWTKGDMRKRVKDGMAYCALGAIKASGAKAYAQAYPWLQAAVGGEEVSVMIWNDSPKRTKGEVLAAFDRAIKAVSK